MQTDFPRNPPLNQGVSDTYAACFKTLTVLYQIILSLTIQNYTRLNVKLMSYYLHLCTDMLRKLYNAPEKERIDYVLTYKKPTNPEDKTEVRCV